MCLSGLRAAEYRRSCRARETGRATISRWQSFTPRWDYSDRSLEYLRKALEEGYKDFNNVYKERGIRRVAEG